MRLTITPTGIDISTEELSGASWVASDVAEIRIEDESVVLSYPSLEALVRHVHRAEMNLRGLPSKRTEETSDYLREIRDSLDQIARELGRMNR